MSKKKIEQSELGKIVAEARVKKGLSQRGLAKIVNMDPAELNRLEAGERKKPSVLYLKGIAETLDLSMKKLMKLADYSDFEINSMIDNTDKRSTKDYQEQIEIYERFYFDVLEDIENRRKTTRSARGIIADLVYQLENNENISKDKILTELKEALEISKNNLNKLDKEKYPKIDHLLFKKADISSNVKINTKTGNFIEEEK